VKLDLLVEQAQAHFWMGKTASVSGRELLYGPQYREAVRFLEIVNRQPGIGRVLDRADLKDIYQEAKNEYPGAA